MGILFFLVDFLILVFVIFFGLSIIRCRGRRIFRFFFLLGRRSSLRARFTIFLILRVLILVLLVVVLSISVLVFCFLRLRVLFLSIVRRIYRCRLCVALFFIRWKLFLDRSSSFFGGFFLVCLSFGVRGLLRGFLI